MWGRSTEEREGEEWDGCTERGGWPRALTWEPSGARSWSGRKGRREFDPGGCTGGEEKERRGYVQGPRAPNETSSVVGGGREEGG